LPAALVLWNPAGGWMDVCCECQVLSGRGTVPAMSRSPVQSSPTDCDASLFDIGTSRIRRRCPALGRIATGKKRKA